LACLGHRVRQFHQLRRSAARRSCRNAAHRRGVADRLPRPAFRDPRGDRSRRQGGDPRAHARHAPRRVPAGVGPGRHAQTIYHRPRGSRASGTQGEGSPRASPLPSIIAGQPPMAPGGKRTLPMTGVAASWRRSRSAWLSASRPTKNVCGLPLIRAACLAYGSSGPRVAARAVPSCRAASRSTIMAV